MSLKDTQTAHGESNEHCPLSPTDIFTLLEDLRRRYVLHFLAKRGGASDLAELATQIVQWEQKTEAVMDDHYERVVTSLGHSHLPQLEDAGILVYHRNQNRIKLCDTANVLTPFLELTAHADFE